MKNEVTVLTCKSVVKEHLRAIVAIRHASGLILNDCCVLQSERGYWASPPSKPQIDRDGNVMREASGKVRYTAIIEFASREIRDRWSAAVVEALRESHPEAFVPGGAA